MPAVSIITVNLNNKTGLEKTIKSVLVQSFVDYEFIIVDGGSTDGSRELIEIHQEHLASGISEKDSGVYFAMNKGIKLASGDYCLFLNSGDTLFSADTLSEVFGAVHHEDIVYGNMIIDLMNGTKQEGKMPEVITLKHMLEDTLWHPVSFIKRSLFESIGMYNEQYSIAADYDFFLRAICINKVSLSYLNQTIAVFALDGMSSLESNKGKLLRERRRIQLQYFSESEISNTLGLNMFEKLNRKVKSWIN